MWDLVDRDEQMKTKHDHRSSHRAVFPDIIWPHYIERTKKRLSVRLSHALVPQTDEKANTNPSLSRQTGLNTIQQLFPVEFDFIVV